MAADGPFDRNLRRLRRNRGGDSAWLETRIAGELEERLELVARRFERALVLGGSRMLANRLRARGIEVILADAGARLPAGGVQCDEDRLPFADGAFDLVVAAGAIDTVNDLPGALVLIRRALRPDGLFLAAFAGAGSLPALRAACAAADEAEDNGASPRIHPQIDVRAAGDLMARAGFALPVADSERFDVRYLSLLPLVRDLRAIAATNILAARARRPIGRLGLAAAITDFESRADPEGRTVERFEIIHLSGWAPAPGQPQPARRGSAAVSLSAALKRNA